MLLLLPRIPQHLKTTKTIITYSSSLKTGKGSFFPLGMAVSARDLTPETCIIINTSDSSRTMEPHTRLQSNWS